jgi:hypothetical protein
MIPTNPTTPADPGDPAQSGSTPSPFQSTPPADPGNPTPAPTDAPDQSSRQQSATDQQLPDFWKFSEHEVKDLFGIVDRLRRQADPVSVFLWQSLSNPEQLLLINYQPSAPKSRQAQAVVVQALNKKIGEPCIYEADRFKFVSLRPETTGLMTQNPSGSDLARLNRLLLEDTYPLELSKNPPASEQTGWVGEAPSILKQPEGRARVSAAVGGGILGVCLAVLCFFIAPHGSILGRMFDLREVQVILPISILTVFFWGLFLCFYRWQRVRASERVCGFSLVVTATQTLKNEGDQALSTRLAEPNAEFNPLLCRLKGLMTQWQLKPGLMEADLVLQQFVVDDEESTRRAYSLIRTFVWALPVLGLLGTVLGIAFAVGGFASFLGGRVDDVEAIKKSLVGVTGGFPSPFC